MDDTDEDLRALHRDVVEPIARSILRDDELDSVRVHRDAEDPGEIYATIVGRGEAYIHLLSSPSWDEHQSLDRLADRLVDGLEDWVCETRFAWGERRIGNKDAMRRDGT